MNQTKNCIQPTPRNYGIDLLRVVAAFYVIILHTINRGGIVHAVTDGSYQQMLCNILLISAMCAVNIFGIISGYVGYREPFKKITYSSYLPLWLTVVFYCVLSSGICLYLFPGSVTSMDFVKSFFPLTKDLFWYFSAYTLVYFFSPFLNKILYFSSEKELKQLFFFICCILATIDYIGESFQMAYGYSAIWLMLLYLVGGIIKKTGIGSKLPVPVAFLAIIIIDICFFYISFQQSNFEFLIFNLDFVVCKSYVTPVYLTTAILHVLLFSKLKFGPLGKRIIQLSAPAAFSVYIANTNPAFWNNLMNGRFAQWAFSSPAGILVRTTLFSAVFVAAVIIIDFFRRKLFLFIGVQHWSQKLSKFLYKYDTV